MTTLSRTTSYLGQMEERLEKITSEQMATLNARSLKAVIAWIELRYLKIAVEVSGEDDPLQSAKLRGKAELTLELNSSLAEMLGQIGKRREEDKPEEAEE